MTRKELFQMRITQSLKRGLPTLVERWHQSPIPVSDLSLIVEFVKGRAGGVGERASGLGVDLGGEPKLGAGGLGVVVGQRDQAGVGSEPVVPGPEG